MNVRTMAAAFAACAVLAPVAVLADGTSAPDAIALATTTPLIGRFDSIALTITAPGSPCSYDLSVVYDSDGYVLPVVPLTHMLYVPHSEAGPAQTKQPCASENAASGSTIVLDPPSLMLAPGRYRLSVGRDGAKSNTVVIEIAP